MFVLFVCAPIVCGGGGRLGMSGGQEQEEAQVRLKWFWCVHILDRWETMEVEADGTGAMPTSKKGDSTPTHSQSPVRQHLHTPRGAAAVFQGP